MSGVITPLVERAASGAQLLTRPSIVGLTCSRPLPVWLWTLDERCALGTRKVNQPPMSLTPTPAFSSCDNRFDARILYLLMLPYAGV
jgi:hypothetical protein